MLPLTLREALLGGDVKVRTLKGHVVLTIPAGTQPGSVTSAAASTISGTQSGSVCSASRTAPGRASTGWCSNTQTRWSRWGRR